MQQYRTGEEGGPAPLRSDRFYKVGDDWYFQVRGGTCFGPYSCRDEADQAVRQMFPAATPKGSKAGGAVIHPFGSLRARRWYRDHKF